MNKINRSNINEKHSYKEPFLSYIKKDAAPWSYGNFHNSEMPIYEETIRWLGDSTIYISDIAKDDVGRIINDHFSLMSTSYKNMHDFWELFKEVKKGG